MADLFRQLAKRMASTWHGKCVQIFGIAAMVYSSLTVTRMHDLMVTISLGFFIAVDIVLLHWLWRRRAIDEAGGEQQGQICDACNPLRQLPAGRDGGIACFAENGVLVIGWLAVMAAQAQRP